MKKVFYERETQLFSPRSLAIVIKLSSNSAPLSRFHAGTEGASVARSGWMGRELKRTDESIRKEQFKLPLINKS
jgi:hypothetical protein